MQACQGHKWLTGHRIKGSCDYGVIFCLRLGINVGQRPRSLWIEGVPYPWRLSVRDATVEGEAQTRNILLRPRVGERAYGNDRVAAEFIPFQVCAEADEWCFALRSSASAPLAPDFPSQLHKPHPEG